MFETLACKSHLQRPPKVVPFESQAFAMEGAEPDNDGHGPNPGQPIEPKMGQGVVSGLRFKIPAGVMLWKL